MGWTGYNASHYKRDGSIDRKAELDAELFRAEDAENGCKLVKSALVGTTWYGAVRDPRGDVYGLVVLTRTDGRNADGCNFFYKDMSEDMGPYSYDCPPSILNLLTPTDNGRANEWRERCREKREQKRSPASLSNLPVGTRIRFNLNGTETEFVKHPPAYQFKRPFWYCPERNTYISRNRIPDDFKIVAA